MLKYIVEVSANIDQDNLKYFKHELMPQSLVPIFGAFEDKIDMPEGNDERIRAFAVGAGRMIARDTLVKFEIVDFVVYRDGIMPSTKINLLQRALTKQILKDPSAYGDFPYAYDESEIWGENLKQVIIDNREKMSTDNFRLDLMCRNVQSNKEERYKSIKIIAELFEARFKGELSILDLGASLNHGLKKIALDQELPFSPATIIPMQRSQNDYSKEMEQLKSAQTKKIKLGQSLGVDVTNIYDTEINEWVLSCSFRPGEWLNPQNIQAFKTLDDSSPEQVGYLRADARDTEVIREASKGQKYDITFLCTMLYMVTDPLEREEMIQSALEMTKENGLVVIQDAVSVDPSDRRKLVFSKGFFPWGYKTLILDKTHLDRGFETVLTWDEGRCNKAKVNVGSSAFKEFLAGHQA